MRPAYGVLLVAGALLVGIGGASRDDPSRLQWTRAEGAADTRREPTVEEELKSLRQEFNDLRLDLWGASEPSNYPLGPSVVERIGRVERRLDVLEGAVNRLDQQVWGAAGYPVGPSIIDSLASIDRSLQLLESATSDLRGRVADVERRAR